MEGDRPVCTTIGRKTGDTTPVRPLGLGLDGREPAGSIEPEDTAAQPPPALFAQRIVTRMGRDEDSGRSLEPGPATPDAPIYESKNRKDARRRLPAGGPMPTPVTASMLYGLVMCPRRVTMDLNNSPARRIEPNPFVKMLEWI